MPDDITTLLLGSIDSQLHEIKVFLLMIMDILLAIGAMLAPSTAYSLVYVIGGVVTAGLLLREFNKHRGENSG